LLRSMVVRVVNSRTVWIGLFVYEELTALGHEI
jgi:hypothetical protein